MKKHLMHRLCMLLAILISGTTVFSFMPSGKVLAATAEKISSVAKVSPTAKVSPVAKVSPTAKVSSAAKINPAANAGLRAKASSATTISPESPFLYLDKGQSKSLKIPKTKKKVRFTSSDKSVATVSKKGLVKAKKSGTTRIRVKAGKKKTTYTVVVTKPKLSRKKATLYQGQHLILDLEGTVQKVRFRTSDKTVATVTNTTGKKSWERPRTVPAIVTAKKPGTAVIRVKAGKKTYRCKITVKKKPKQKKTFSTAMTNTAVNLLRNAYKEAGPGTNILISPDSIITATSMVGNGAAGKTKEEIQTALGGWSIANYNKNLLSFHKRLENHEWSEYHSANSVWYLQSSAGLREQYKKVLKKYYQAESHAVSFDDSTVDQINRWVSEKTNGKIEEIIKEITPGTRSILTNAVYFKGEWEKKYGRSVSRKFTRTDGKKQKARMLEDIETEYVEIPGAKGFVKNYLGGNMAMMVLLPQKGTTVEKFVAGLTGRDLTDAYRNRISTDMSVDTRMPEFEYEYSASLKRSLRRMGIRQAFSPKADFSNMSEEPFYVDDILHKTFIRVDKDGTEAAAVTAVMMKASAFFMQREKIMKKVYLDRPFVYAIVDTATGIPLFLGVVEKP